MSSDIFGYYRTPAKNLGTPKIKNVTPINVKRLAGILFQQTFFPVFSHKMLMFVFYQCVSLLLFFSDDHSRVILSLTENDPESHYINANYIDVSDIMKLCLK